jgi:hypothetical protein
MSNKNKPPVIKKESSPEEEVWDEQRLKESLDQLKILHMLEPLRTKQQTRRHFDIRIYMRTIAD